MRRMKEGGGFWSRVRDVVVPPWLLVVAPVLGAAIGALFLFDPRVFLGGDNGLYWALARSMTELGEYRNLTAAGAPFEASVPWGFPALLAAASLLTGGGYLQMKWVAFVCLIGAVLCLARWGRALDGRGLLGFAAAAAAAVNVRFLSYGSEVLSEAPYLLLSFGALLAFDHERLRARWWGIAPTAALAGCAYLVRPIGVSLIVALLAMLVVARRWRDLRTAAVITAALCGSWHVRSLLVPTTEENLYLRWFVKRAKYQTDDSTAGPLDLVDRLVHNSGAYLFEQFPNLAFSREWIDSYAHVVALPLVALGVYGYAVTARSPRLVHVYLLLYLGATFLWLRESVTPRYLVPVYPLLLAFTFTGAASAGARIGPRAVFALPAALFTLIAAAGIQDLVLRSREMWWVRNHVAAGDEMAGRGDSERDFVEMAEWARDHGPEGALFASRKERMIWFYSGHEGFTLEPIDDPIAMLQWLSERRVDFVVVDTLRTSTRTTKRRLDPALQRCPTCFETVFTAKNGDYIAKFHLDEVKPPDAPASGAPPDVPPPWSQ